MIPPWKKEDIEITKNVAEEIANMKPEERLREMLRLHEQDNDRDREEKKLSAEKARQQHKN